MNVPLKKREPLVRNFSDRKSGAGNGYADFVGAWHFWFFLLENPHAHKIHRFRGGGVLTREMGTICPFGIFPCFIVFFDSTLAIFPLKRSVLELEKAIFGPEKDKR